MSLKSGHGLKLQVKRGDGLQDVHIARTSHMLSRTLNILLTTKQFLCFIFSLLTDELIKDVQIGCHYSFVVLRSCEIHECSGQFLCTPVFEVKCLQLWLEVFAFARFILSLLEK